MDWRSMDDRVGANNEVRVIDAFVDSLPIGEMGFDVVDDSDEDDGGQKIASSRSAIFFLLIDKGYLEKLKSFFSNTLTISLVIATAQNADNSGLFLITTYLLTC